MVCRVSGPLCGIDALVASVQELGRLTGVATPTIDTVLGLIRLRARTAGLY